jgi:hypothetical protein
MVMSKRPDPNRIPKVRANRFICGNFGQQGYRFASGESTKLKGWESFLTQWG